MDLNDSSQQAEFREKVKAWLKEHASEAPPRAPTGDEDAYIQARREWQGKLAEGGLAGVTWPKELGGQAALGELALPLAPGLDIGVLVTGGRPRRRLARMLLQPGLHLLPELGLLG